MNNHGPPNVYITSLVDMRVTQPGHLWGKEVSEAGWVGCIWFTSGRQRPQTPGQVHVKVNIFVPEKKKKKKTGKACVEGDYHLLNPNLDYLSPVFTCTVSFGCKLTIFTTFYSFTKRAFPENNQPEDSTHSGMFLIPFNCCHLPRLQAIGSISFYLGEKLRSG